MKTKMQADTKLTIAMCSQIFNRKSTAPSSFDFCWLAHLDYDSWSLRKNITLKSSSSKYVFKKNKIKIPAHGDTDTLGVCG